MPGLGQCQSRYPGERGDLHLVRGHQFPGDGGGAGAGRGTAGALAAILENPALTPAFDNVVPALFGALGLKYFLKGKKFAAIPLVDCQPCVYPDAFHDSPDQCTADCYWRADHCGGVAFL